GVCTGVRTTELARTSRLVAQHAGVAVPPNKAIVGANAFAHEAGIHQDGVLKHRATYEIMNAESVGRTSQLALGKHSGRGALRHRVNALGLQVSDRDLTRMSGRMKEVAASRKGTVDDADLRRL